MEKKQAIKYYGSGAKLCEALGLHRMNIVNWGYWLQRKHARELDDITNGELSFDKELYDDKVRISIDGKTFKPAIDISAFAKCQKEVSDSTEYFFVIEDESLIMASLVSNEDLKHYFKSQPLYKLVCL